MSKPLVSDDLWAIIEPLLPPKPPKPKGGRPRLSNRAALTGIIFVLKSSISLGNAAPGTRLCDWQQAGVQERLHQTLLQRLSDAGRLDWSRASLDSVSIPVPRGAKRADPTRRIVANRGRSVILWSNGTASRWP